MSIDEILQTQIRKGRAAREFLMSPVVEEFFEAQTMELFGAFRAPGADLQTLHLKAVLLEQLHEHLKRAVFAGETTADRLRLASKKGETG